VGFGKYITPKLYVSYGVSLIGSGQVLTLKYLLRKGFDMEIESSTVENRGSVNWRKENRAPRGAQALFLPCVAVLPCDGPGRPGPPLAAPDQFIGSCRRWPPTPSPGPFRDRHAHREGP
jgi:hypothetical protein